MKENVLKDKSLLFAIRIVNLYKFLTSEHKEYVLSKQVLRSGTSVGAMVREAEFGQSKQDFIHKLSIAQKEINETIYWLELCKFSDNYPNVDELIDKVNNISRIVNKIIITSKQK